MPSAISEDQILWQLMELRQELTTLRLTVREMGRELKSVLSIHPIPSEAELSRDDQVWMRAVTLAARAYSVPPGRVLSRERTDRVAAARQFAFWLCVKVAGWSMAHCGRVTGRNHGTVHWGINQHVNEKDARKSSGFSLPEEQATAEFKASLTTSSTPPTTTTTAHEKGH